MTTIEITPLHTALFSRARITAKPIHGTFDDMQAWEFDQFTSPFIALAPPPVNDAWIFVLTIGAISTTRTVTFSGTVVTWDSLIDVDPATFEPVPVGAALAEWEAVRDQLIEYTDRQLAAHVVADTPHPAYDDMPDLTLIFENKLDTGLVVDDAFLPDLTLTFNSSL